MQSKYKKNIQYSFTLVERDLTTITEGRNRNGEDMTTEEPFTATDKPTGIFHLLYFIDLLYYSSISTIL